MGWFDRFKKKRPEKIGKKRLGHRGIGIGSLENKDLSAENIAKWQMLSGDEVEDFVHFGEPLFVHSTVISMAQYFAVDQKLLIEYLDGSSGTYGNISEEEAYEFAAAQSKNSWVWDYCRVRGTKHQHKKPWTEIK